MFHDSSRLGGGFFLKRPAYETYCRGMDKEQLGYTYSSVSDILHSFKHLEPQDRILNPTVKSSESRPRGESPDKPGTDRLCLDRKTGKEDQSRCRGPRRSCIFSAQSCCQLLNTNTELNTQCLNEMALKQPLIPPVQKYYLQYTYSISRSTGGRLL
jgi:hypothetical protein